MSILKLEKIWDFANLKKGWNGYSADPPNYHAVAKAIEVLEISLGFGARPRVVPSVMGGMGLTWKNGDREIYLEIYNVGEPYVLQTVGHEITTFPAIIETEQEINVMVWWIIEWLGLD